MIVVPKAGAFANPKVIRGVIHGAGTVPDTVPDRFGFISGGLRVLR